jgi:thioredoxin reductase (NADPH)
VALPAADIVIVGAGPAGVAAAVQCQRLGARPLLLDRRGEAGGLVANGFSVENYPGVEPMPGRELVKLLKAHLRRFNLAVKEGSVQRIAKENNGFVVEGDFGTIRSRAVIVAVGTRPKALPIPGAAELAMTRLFYEVRHLFDQGSVQTMKRALVIGGGEAALDYSLSLAGVGVEATVLVRGEGFRAKGRLVQLVERSPLIKAVFRAAPREVSHKAQGIELKCTTADEVRTYYGDGVIVAIGRESEAGDLLSGLDAKGAKTVSTEVPGLFIAGDARWGALGQVGMAVGDGLTAAIAAVEGLDAS